MPDEPNENVNLLIDDLAEWARGARLRGFSAREIVSALGTSGLEALSGAGLTPDRVHDIVDQHYGVGAHAVRPSAKA